MPGTSGMEASFWCFACSRLHRPHTQDEPIAGCTRCGTPAATLEGIIDLRRADRGTCPLCRPPVAGANDRDGLVTRRFPEARHDAERAAARWPPKRRPVRPDANGNVGLGRGLGVGWEGRSGGLRPSADLRRRPTEDPAVGGCDRGGAGRRGAATGPALGGRAAMGAALDGDGDGAWAAGGDMRRGGLGGDGGGAWA
uniref:Uncharacterized protein n=1 Tax=Setaria viridis TaxID=4556 RepID=A0A4U6VVV4_SETVI|nr:hypothetical protein SEVIR_2G244500v2 [Setaria viridis]